MHTTNKLNLAMLLVTLAGSPALLPAAEPASAPAPALSPVSPTRQLNLQPQMAQPAEADAAVAPAFSPAAKGLAPASTPARASTPAAPGSVDANSERSAGIAGIADIAGGTGSAGGAEDGDAQRPWFPSADDDFDASNVPAAKVPGPKRADGLDAFPVLTLTAVQYRSAPGVGFGVATNSGWVVSQSFSLARNVDLAFFYIHETDTRGNAAKGLDAQSMEIGRTIGLRFSWSY